MFYFINYCGHHRPWNTKFYKCYVYNAPIPTNYIWKCEETVASNNFAHFFNNFCIKFTTYFTFIKKASRAALTSTSGPGIDFAHADNMDDRRILPLAPENSPPYFDRTPSSLNRRNCNRISAWHNVRYGLVWETIPFTAEETNHCPNPE